MNDRVSFASRSEIALEPPSSRQALSAGGAYENAGDLSSPLCTWRIRDSCNGEELLNLLLQRQRPIHAGSTSSSKGSAQAGLTSLFLKHDRPAKPQWTREKIINYPETKFINK